MAKPTAYTGYKPGDTLPPDFFDRQGGGDAGLNSPNVTAPQEAGGYKPGDTLPPDFFDKLENPQLGPEQPQQPQQPQRALGAPQPGQGGQKAWQFKFPSGHTATWDHNPSPDEIATAYQKYEGKPMPQPQGGVNSLSKDDLITLSAKADCSLFTQRVFQREGYAIPRTAIQQFRATPMVMNQGDNDYRKLKPGDLIFFDNGRRTPFNTQGKAIVGADGDVEGYVNHVGIYAGNGKVIHDPGNGTVKETTLEALIGHGLRFMGATRPYARPADVPPTGVFSPPSTEQQIAESKAGTADEMLRRALAKVPRADRADVAMYTADPAEVKRVAKMDSMDRAQWIFTHSKKGQGAFDTIRKGTGAAADSMAQGLANGYAWVFGQSMSPEAQDLAKSTIATALNIPVDAVQHPGETMAQWAAVEAGLYGAGVFGRAITKAMRGAEGITGQMVRGAEQLAIARKYGVNSGRFARAVLDAADSGVDIKAIANAVKAQDAPLARVLNKGAAAFQQSTQQVVEGALTKSRAPFQAEADALPELIAQRRITKGPIPDAAAKTPYAQFMDEWWRPRTEGLVNAMRQEIADTKGAGRKLGPVVRQLEQSLQSGTPHPAIVSELDDIWKAKNPGEVPTPAPAEPTVQPAGPIRTPEAPQGAPGTIPVPTATPTVNALETAPQGPDLGFNAEPAPAAAVRTRASETPRSSINTPEVPNPTDPEIIQRFAREETKAYRERYGLGEYAPDGRTWDDVAAQAVARGYNTSAGARRVLDQTPPQRFTPEHKMGLGLRLQQIDRDLRAAIESGNTSVAANLDAEGEAIANALDKSGTAAGRSLAIHNAILKDDYSRFAVRVKAARAVGDRPLTADEVQALNDASDHIQNLETGLQKRLAANRANPGAAAAPNPRGFISESDYQAARKAFAKLPDSAQMALTGLPPEKWAALAKIAAYHAENGARDLGDLIARIKGDTGVADEQAAIAANEGLAAFARKVNTGKEFGEGVLIEGKNGISHAGIVTLRRRLDALRAEMKLLENTPDQGLVDELRQNITKIGGQYKQLEQMSKSKTPLNIDDFRALKAQISETSRKINAGKAQAADLLQQGRSAIIDPEVVSLRRQIASYKNEVDRHLKVLQAIEDYNNLTPIERGAVTARDFANLPRTLKASFDFSAPLRQGVFFTITHPGLTIRAASGLDFAPSMFKAFGSEEAYQEITAIMRSSEWYDLATQSKLFLADVDAPLLKMTGKEEAFGSSIAEHIPGVRGSERAYAAFLNKQRFDMFSYYADAAKMSGKPLTEEQAAAVADFINIATGRGTGKIADVASHLGTMFFAPRYTVSRFQLVGGSPLWRSIVKTGFTSTSTKIIAKEYAKFYGTALVTMGALHYALKGTGWSIGLDPRSSDFGKLIHGNSRISIFGGMEQIPRLVAQLLYGRIDKFGNVTPPSPSEEADIIGRFLGQKQNPLISVPYQWYTGKDLISGDYDWKRAIVDMFMPLTPQQGWDSVKEEGPWVGGLMVLADMFGAATNIQEPKRSPLGGEYDVSNNTDPTMQELLRVGYEHVINKSPFESKQDYVERRNGFDKFAMPSVVKLVQGHAEDADVFPAPKDMSEDQNNFYDRVVGPDGMVNYKDATRADKKRLIRALLDRQTKLYYSTPQAEGGYQEKYQAMQDAKAKADADEIARQAKAGEK